MGWFERFINIIRGSKNIRNENLLYWPAAKSSSRRHMTLVAFRMAGLLHYVGGLPHSLLKITIFSASLNRLNLENPLKINQAEYSSTHLLLCRAVGTDRL